MTLLVSVNKKRQLREFSRRLFFKTERSRSGLYGAASADGCHKEKDSWKFSIGKYYHKEKD